MLPAIKWIQTRHSRSYGEINAASPINRLACAVLTIVVVFVNLLRLDTCVAQPPAQDWAPASAVIVKLSSAGKLQFDKLTPSEPLPPMTPSALLVWKPESGPELWTFLKPGGTWPSDVAALPATKMNGTVRGSDARGLGGVSTTGTLGATLQLAPLDGTTLIRGAAFVTPQDGAEILSARPTIRRTAEKGQLPARVAKISRDNTDEIVLSIPFREGQTEVVLSEWKQWPPQLTDGLPPGRYSLRFDKGLEFIRFSVLDANQRQRYLSPIDSMSGLIGDKSDPFAVQYGVEHLLSFRTDEGRPLFLGDALDLIESVNSHKLSVPLQRHRKSLRDWLDKLAADPGYHAGQFVTPPLGSSTGIDSVDAARQLIAAGQWTEALSVLDQIPDNGDDDLSLRRRALKSLYRGVVFSEAGSGRPEEAIGQFTKSIDALMAMRDTPQRQADLLRAYNNSANFRLLLASNSLGNHAFQMAAGVDQPIMSCMLNLIEAREQYAAAAKIAEQLQDQRAGSAIRVNQARTSALLADVIRTLDVANVETGLSRQFADGERAATGEAVKFASMVTQEDAVDVDPLTVAAGWELIAQLEYRQGNYVAASESAGKARTRFVKEGDLAGVETIERLLGLVAISKENRPDALKHFSIAQQLAELLRSRFPQDQTGQSRAGYFARHSFIYEKLVELHLIDGQPLKALKYAELAKARAAQDLLGTLGITEQEESIEPRDLDELLADWPADVAAVEYFLGAERAWGFVILSGKVRAFPLLDANGRPVATRQLVADVRQFLTGIESQAEKMRRRLMAARGFDHAWQDRLLDLRRTLLPDDLLAELREAKRLIVVPQHILHYLPFAALVTDRDSAPRTKNEMVRPKFILDESFSITSAPSLTTWDLIRRRSHAPLSQVRAVGLVSAPGAPVLEGVEQDLKNLRAIYGDKIKQVLEGNEATVGNAKKLLAEPGLLMFATHGFNDADHPAESFLLLLEDTPVSAGDVAAENEVSGDANNGRLTAKEIYKHRINARLIVMSACYSGLGDRSPMPGDDLFGLQRAFLYSGARSVLSGLWDVYDGTAPDLIRGFHENVRDGNLPSVALAKSQRKFINTLRSNDESSPWLHPYFWSMFCISGAE